MKRTMQRRRPYRSGKARFSVVHSLLSLTRQSRVAEHYTALERMELRASLQRWFRRKA